MPTRGRPRAQLVAWTRRPPLAVPEPATPRAERGRQAACAIALGGCDGGTRTDGDVPLAGRGVLHGRRRVRAPAIARPAWRSRRADPVHGPTRSSSILTSASPSTPAPTSTRSPACCPKCCMASMLGACQCVADRGRQALPADEDDGPPLTVADVLGAATQTRSSPTRMTTSDELSDEWRDDLLEQIATRSGRPPSRAAAGSGSSSCTSRSDGARAGPVIRAERPGVSAPGGGAGRRSPGREDGAPKLANLARDPWPAAAYAGQGEALGAALQRDARREACAQTERDVRMVQLADPSNPFLEELTRELARVPARNRAARRRRPRRGPRLGRSRHLSPIVRVSTLQRSDGSPTRIAEFECLTVPCVLGPIDALERRLAADVAELQRDDPLRPVVVLVGETLLRAYLRRRIAEINGPYLNVHIVTPGRAGAAAGRDPADPRGPAAATAARRPHACPGGGALDEHLLRCRRRHPRVRPRAAPHARRDPPRRDHAGRAERGRARLARAREARRARRPRAPPRGAEGRPLRRRRRARRARPERVSAPISCSSTASGIRPR